MRKRAGQSFAASASAKQMPVHCAAMVARKTDDKDADTDHHAVPPPAYQAGVDSKREKLVSARARKSQQNDARSIKLRATGCDWSSIKLQATGSRERSVKNW